MATTFSTARHLTRRNSELPHRLRVTVVSAAVATLILGLAIGGSGYYRMDIAERVDSPLHPLLRPSGAIGLRLGMLGFALFLVLALYPLRKRWRWLGSIGKTSHWLDFHALVGITAPILITFHSSFKLGGLAGIAYWIMIAVALSGFVGRYLYSQIPRSLNAVQLDLGELQSQARHLAEELDRQCLLPVDALAPLLRIPTPAQVRGMSLCKLLWTMFCLDLARPVLVSRLRSRVLRGSQRFLTLGGCLKSGQSELELAIASVRRQSWLGTKMAFLDRAQRAFHLWHVIHRPFSISFFLLVLVHVGVVLMLGYF